MENKIYSINGPVITVKDTNDFSMLEMVYVGHKKLLGEVIKIDNDLVTIQVYESTTGLKPNEPVVGSKELLYVTLGPGIVGNIFDGIERPLKDLYEKQGAFIDIGSQVDSLDVEKLWNVEVLCKVGDYLYGGSVYAQCQETSLIMHRCLLSPSLSGQVIEVVENGAYNIKQTIVKIKDDYGLIHNIDLTSKWPIRNPRPIRKRLGIHRPLITGQRVIDTLFPIAKGGAASVPGGFGSGKTMTQHQIAKWCDADLIVYVGCGERGNEMTQVLQEFSELIDPKSNQPLLARTVLIANTSNMPVAAREASIYTGITLAEYYRDMGYHVAIMADSTSRWAEALREISGRLEEMPAEEGFPAYLPSRIAQFYERAGLVKTLNQQEGSITIIGAVSPQGADFSEPVTQNTKRFVRCFWALDKSLAYARHYPAINWNTSYSEYIDDLSKYYSEQVARDFSSLRKEMIMLLAEENKLNEIVKLIGADVLPDDQKLILLVAKIIRVGFLQQNAYHQEDTYVPLAKQYQMLKVIHYFYQEAKKLVTRKIPVSLLNKTGIIDKIIKIKYDVRNDDLMAFDNYYVEIDQALKSID
ncbi:V-type ATP synthase subunit A [Erysipelotrichaceae bacterium OH741_COT-311]|nr:V-type ATP synthase subunit A [Erysipelotrichaceae bacterium OH741_COT-311]